MTQEHVVRVAEWSETPGARERTVGPHSGEEFREEVLAPAFRRAVEADTMLTVDLDGVYGYAASFLEEVFGGLARQFGPETVHNHLLYVTTDEPDLEEEIRGYVAEARQDT